MNRTSALTPEVGVAQAPARPNILGRILLHCLSLVAENEKIMVQFSATPGPGRLAEKPSVDLSLALKILRLHGGGAFIGTSGEPPAGGYLITCELPVIRLSEC